MAKRNRRWNKATSDHRREHPDHHIKHKELYDYLERENRRRLTEILLEGML